MMKDFWEIEELYSAIDTEEAVKNVNMTSELFWAGVITKENALRNLWRHFNNMRENNLKVMIANKIQHIESGRW